MNIIDTAGGATLTNKSINYDSGTNITTFDADDVVWSSSTVTARYCVLYSDTSSVILGYADFGINKSSSGGDFTVYFNADGIFTVTV